MNENSQSKHSPNHAPTSDSREEHSLLIEVEAQCQKMIELSPDPAAIVREDLLSFVNSAWVRLFGAASPQEIVGKRMTDFIHQNDQPIIRAAGNNGGRRPVARQQASARILRMDGSVGEAEISRTPILLEGAAATLVFLSDVSDRKQAEAELQKTKSWLEMVLSCMSDGLSVFDHQYRWIFMNKVDEARIRETGLDPASILGEVLWDEMPELADTHAGQKLRQVMEQRISASFEGWCGDHYFEIYLSPTEDGGVSALTRDISDRRRAQDELNRSEEALRRANEDLEKKVRRRTAELARMVEELQTQHEEKKRAEKTADTERRRLEHLTELLPVGIMLLSSDYRVIFENRFFRERFGEPDSRHCYELLFGRTEPCNECMGLEILKTNAPNYWEMSDRKGHTYSLYGFPFPEADESNVILVIGIDTTERTRAQQQLESANKQLAARAEQLRAMLMELSRAEDRQRRSLAQVLHDELQQLLVAIKLGAEFLLHQIADEEPRTDAHRIIDLAAQSISVTRSLTTELSPPVLHETGLVGGLQWLARWIKENHGLEVRISTQETTPALPEELRTVLFQAVRELLFNVVKHAGTNQAWVTVTHDGGRSVHITVEDHGKGFVFSETCETTPGSFGLFSIRERLSILNGDMEIDSTPGIGTKITLHVPIPHEEKPKVRVSKTFPEVVPETAITEPGMARVLVVDDHTVVREGLVEILHKQPGVVVVGEAVDGMEALERARQLHPSVILMDVTLPRMSGIDATRIITREMPDIRVIGLSMHAQEDMASRMREAGAARYMLKDCPVGEIVTAIYETMNIKIRPIV